MRKQLPITLITARSATQMLHTAASVIQNRFRQSLGNVLNALAPIGNDNHGHGHGRLSQLPPSDENTASNESGPSDGVGRTQADGDEAS